MAIHYKCGCGANIRMPVSAAGKQARCRSCGTVFTVPDREYDQAGQPIPQETDRSRRAADQGSAEEPGSWLEEFARIESQATPEPPAAPIEFTPEEPAPAKVEQAVSARPATDENHVSLDDGRDWIAGPEQSFWRDLAQSFVFFMSPGNLVTFLIIALINAMTVPLSFAGILGVIGQVLVLGYLCAFYMSTIRETASGEDELPTVWISSMFDDLVMPLVQFIGTWAWVLLPAGVVALVTWHNMGEVPWTLVRAVAVAGLFFWPVVILGVAIGGGFKGLWPHTIVHTALAAPVVYLAVCATLAIAAGILILPSTDVWKSVFDRLGLAAGFSVKLMILNSVLTAYAMIVAMRAVGLLYRHRKHKFPWVAE